MATLMLLGVACLSALQPATLRESVLQPAEAEAEAPLHYFFHLHKAAGSSICQLARTNGER